MLSDELIGAGITVKRKIAYILGGFPQDTQTFVYKEMEELAQLGYDLRVVSLHSKEPNKKHHLDYEKWLPKTCYAGSLHPVAMFWINLRCAFTKPIRYTYLILHYKAFGGKRVCWVAPHVAHYLMREKVGQMHAHFAWSAADLARAVSKLTGIPYSITAHQSDIHRCPERLEEKLRDATKILTCTRGNATFLKQKYPEAVSAKIEAVYHGVDINKFSISPISEEKDIDIISIGELIEVKGFIYVVQALTILAKRGLRPRSVIVGDGTEKKLLLKAIEKAGLSGSVKIVGRMPQYKLSELYTQAKIFVLACIVIDGAPHGIPNVLAEAMATGLPVVSTDVPNIPELIEHDRDGILVREKDPEALADALEELLEDSNKCAAMGRMAREKIEKEFDAREHIKHIAEIFVLQQASN